MPRVNQYEVRCPRCEVTFPTGTKRCVHCGGRTAPSHVRVAAGSPGSHDHLMGPSAEEVVVLPAEGGGLEPLGVEEEAEGGGRSGLVRSAVTLVWVLIAVGFSILRACSES
jgi:hypothetical protein